jgi:cation diffusion facilitator CzcD-associated flavoprotein CzcO
MASDAEAVVMLRRSRTYVVSRPARDRFANFLRSILPDKWAYAITRWRNVLLQQYVYRRTRTRPDKVRDFLLDQVRKELGPDYDVEKHFTPSYNPWDQRLCLVPDSDLFEAIRSGKATVVTDTITQFEENGIRVASGELLEADIIVTATGLNLVVAGEIDISVDGSAVDFAKTWSYRGLMNSDLPNLAAAFGYINASWTLRADLISEYVCRLLNHMDATGTRQVTPRLREEDRDMPALPWIQDFSAGYMERVMHLMPRQSDRAPWMNPQNYRRDKKMFRRGELEDGVLVFDNPDPVASRDPDTGTLLQAAP